MDSEDAGQHNSWRLHPVPGPVIRRPPARVGRKPMNEATDAASLTDTRADRRRILHASLALGERLGWDAVHLHAVAHEAGCSLRELLQLYPDKDALAEAWFDVADDALLRAAERPGWAGLSAERRLHDAIFAWLEALAPHRTLTAAMLGYKLQPEHLHLQARGAVRVSRTVQAIREVALLADTGWRRELSEAALSGIYLATFACWLRDDTAGSKRTRELLERLLRLFGAGAKLVAT